MKSDLIFETLITTFLDIPNSHLSREFRQIRNNYPANIDLKIQSAGQSLVFDTGLRYNATVRNTAPLPGCEIYSKHITRLYKLWRNGQSRFLVYSFDDWTRQHVLTRHPFRYTCLYLSDSWFRNVNVVTGGHVLASGGAHYRDLAKLILRKNIPV